MGRSDDNTYFKIGVGVLGAAALATVAYFGYKRFAKKTPSVELLSEPLKGRSLHWVTRCSDLKPTLEFYKRCFGMQVLRHEENSEPCGITCNGRYNAAWSKTMVGYAKEDEAYCLEVTYNYGVYDYKKGNGLRALGVHVPNVDLSLTRAKELGYEVVDNKIVGPDGYDYVLSATDYNHPRSEPFSFVCLYVSNVQASVDFYTKYIGMQELEGFDVSHVADAAGKTCKVVGYSEEQVHLVLVQANEELRIEQFEGRHAIALPASDIQHVYGLIEKTNPDQIVHEIRHFDENLGRLFIAIVSDPDGYELCLVSEETFNKLAVAATDFVGPNWDTRREFIDKTAKKKDIGRSS